mmetsp:Transcript_5191/g.6886  ORF Transcript_5191/g.6886 Transcript_5191/m.6886 type:complete len:113 (+) Transcript_5191:543-881(+)
MRDALFQRLNNLLYRPGNGQHQPPGVLQAAGVAKDAREARRKRRALPEAEVTAIERATRVPWPDEGRKSQQVGESHQVKGEGADGVRIVLLSSACLSLTRKSHKKPRVIFPR